MTRNELKELLAKTSHQTWMRQTKEPLDPPPDPLDPRPTAHDYDRADDLIRALLGADMLKPYD